MSSYADQVLGPDLGSGASDLLSDQWEAVEMMIQKLEKSGKKRNRIPKKVKRLEEQLQVLAADHQRLLELENDRHKKKRKRKGRGKKGKKNQAKQLKALELQCQQQQLWFQDVMSNAFVKLLISTTGSMNWLPPQAQSVIELPAPRDKK